MKRTQYRFKYIVSREQDSSEPVKLTRLEDESGNHIGFVDEFSGRLYTKNSLFSRVIIERSNGIGFRRCRNHAKRRAAADRLGINRSYAVQHSEDRLLKLLDI